MERPNLSQISEDVLNYIESLEQELSQYRKDASPANQPEDVEFALPPEAPTTVNLVTVSARGIIKRTPRHLYSRQHRGGMGVFDLDIPESDAPRLIFSADETQDILVITDFGNAYRLPLNLLVEASVRDRGKSIDELISLPADERINVVLPAMDAGYLALLSDEGYVRTLRHNYVGANLKPGTPIFDVGKYGALIASAWTSGKDDLFIATRNGLGIRFMEKLVQNNYRLGIRLEQGDEPVSISGVSEEEGIFLAGADGKGTIRLMSGFRANKAPGANGKIAIKTERLAGAMVVAPDEDLFMITSLCKIIRFPADEIPAKTGATQGVNCMALRADKVVALAN